MKPNPSFQRHWTYMHFEDSDEDDEDLDLNVRFDENVTSSTKLQADDQLLSR